MTVPIDIYNFLYPSTGYPFDWHMVHAERCALETVLRRLKPKAAIEIGTFRGGSLQTIAKYSETVVSIDIDPTVQETLSPQFPGVQFITGDSSKLLPEVFTDLNARDIDLEFVLIDGDHTPDGVKRDIETVLSYTPRSPMVVLMHDSFNPGCRSGMLAADWESSPFVHRLEIDFVCGQIVPYPDAETFGEMWGGLAFALFLPEERSGSLNLSKLYQLNFESSPRWFSDARLAKRLDDAKAN